MRASDGPEALELPVGGRRPGEPEDVVLDGCGQLVEQVADAAAVEGAEVAGEPGGGHRLGLGQVVALGLVGQVGLDHVERGEVRSVLVGPVDPDPDQCARGQVDAGGVLLVAGQHEHRERGAALDGDLVAVLDGARHVAGRPVARCPGGVRGHHGACLAGGRTQAPSAPGRRQLGGEHGGVGRPAPGRCSPGRRRRGPAPVPPTAGSRSARPRPPRRRAASGGAPRPAGRAGHRSPPPRSRPRASRSAVSTVWAKAVGWRVSRSPIRSTTPRACVGVGGVAGQGAEAGEGQGGHRVGRRGGAVEDVLGADDQLLGVVGGGEEPAALRRRRTGRSGRRRWRRPARSTPPGRSARPGG